MGGVHHPPADVQRRAHDAIGAAPLDREHGADDVDDRIELADLVQMDFLDRHLVNLRLGFREALEKSLRAIAAARCERGAVDVREDFRECPVSVILAVGRMVAMILGVAVIVRVAMIMRVRMIVRVGMIVSVIVGEGVAVIVSVRVIVNVLIRDVVMAPVAAVLVHDEFRGGHAGAQDALGGDVEPRHGEASQRAPQVVQRKTRVEQRAEDHVAGDAGEAVEVENP
jgi:hypothetical protein